MPSKRSHDTLSNKDELSPSWLRAPIPLHEDIDRILTQSLEDLRTALYCELCAVLLFDQAEKQQEHWLIVQKPGESVLRYHYPIDLEWDENATRPQWLIDGDLAKAIETDIRSVLNAQVVFENKNVGILIAFNKIGSEEFDLRDQAFIQSATGFLGTALDNLIQARQLDTTNTSLEKGLWTLTHSRNILRSLIDNLPFSLYIIDPNYNLTAVNQARAQIANRAPNQLVGQKCFQALFQRVEVCPNCQVKATLEKGQSRQRIGPDTIGQSHKFWEINSYPIYDDQGQITHAILLEQDVTERQNLENIVAQSEQLAAIGQLAAGVAHEINNPLTAILANAQLLQREIPTADDKQELVDLILQASERATRVVRSLLDLARLENYEFLPIDINDTIRRAIELVKHELISNTIHFNSELASTLPLIQGSQSHLQGVWVNLLLNAVDSLEHQPGEIHIRSQRSGQNIVILVTDSGKGISPDLLPRIFDPFFTTKSAGHGTGLGLSVCNRVIQKHNGHINVQSEVDKGTQFIVTLPIK